MPRINRVATEFTIPSQPGKIWLAEFSHRHCTELCPHTPKHERVFCAHFDGKGRATHPTLAACTHPKVTMTCPDPVLHPVMWEVSVGKMIPVQHVTSVRLRHKGTATFISGAAPCSLHDEYNWRVGIHLALQRALERAGWCTLVKVKDNGDCPHSPIHTAACPAIGKVVVADKQPIYNEIMFSFWREMRVKGAATPLTAVPAHIIPVRALLGPAAQATMHGLGARGDY